MSDDRYDRYDRLDERLAERRTRMAGSPLADTIDLAIRRTTAAIVIAGALIGLGAYAGGSSGGSEPQRYQMTTLPDGRILRLNTDSGTVIGCREDDCAILLQRGQELLEPEEIAPGAATEQPAEAQPAQAVPAPAPPGEQAPPALPAPGNPGPPAPAAD